MSALLSLGTSIGLIPYRATGAEIDLSRFELAFSDEFDGDSLGSEWRSHHFGMGDTVKRRGSYWNRDLAQVESGQLHIKVKYLRAELVHGRIRHGRIIPSKIRIF